MSHAVVMQVKLPEGVSPEERERVLNEQIIPNAKKQSGFQKGVWMRSADNTGVGMVVFDTDEHARAAVSNLQPPPGGPVVTSCAVYEIRAEA